jgi:hypothetical protein
VTLDACLPAHLRRPETRVVERIVQPGRRLAGVLYGAGFSVADASSSGGETLETTPSLGEFYQKMRSGEVNLAAAEGRRAFGLSLIKEAVTRE